MMKSMRFFGFVFAMSVTVVPGSQGQVLPSSGEGVFGGAGQQVSPSAMGRVVREIVGVERLDDGRYLVNYSRPMGRAAELLQRNLGVPISYEDARWDPGSSDVTHAANLGANRDSAGSFFGLGPLVPREGLIEVAIPPLGVAMEEHERIIESVLGDHVRRRNPGVFRLIEFGEGEYSIVAEASEDASGTHVPNSSPLNLRVSFSLEERTIAETLDRLVIGINAQLEDHEIMGPPMLGGPGYFDGVSVQVGADNELARSVLARIFRVPGRPKVSWVLDYMPDVAVYVLGIQRVEVEVETDSGPMLVDVTWPVE